jgi:mono/diheme cytochrome c family protein
MRPLFGVGSASLAATMICGQALAQTPDQASSPEQVYGRTCHYCHDTGVGPVLKDRHLERVYIVSTVRAGRNGMPAFRPSEISNAELLALAQWIELSGSVQKP